MRLDMNERIQELMKLCIEQVYDSRTGSADKLNAEKFAELIVRECAQIGEDVDGNQTTKNEILKHFGVEE